jgi:hypothetical protein
LVFIDPSLFDYPALSSKRLMLTNDSVGSNKAPKPADNGPIVATNVLLSAGLYRAMQAQQILSRVDFRTWLTNHAVVPSPRSARPEYQQTQK